MTTTIHTTCPPSDLEVPQKVDDVYRQLGLDDPAVQRFYDQLDRLNTNTEQSEYWIRTDIRTNVAG